MAVPVAVAVGWDANALAAHSGDGLWGADDDLADALGVDSSNEGFLAGGIEGALAEGIVIGGVNDVDVEPVV